MVYINPYTGSDRRKSSFSCKKDKSVIRDIIVDSFSVIVLIRINYLSSGSGRIRVEVCRVRVRFWVGEFFVVFGSSFWLTLSRIFWFGSGTTRPVLYAVVLGLGLQVSLDTLYYMKKLK